MLTKLFCLFSDLVKRFKDSVVKRGVYHTLIFLATEAYYDRKLKLTTPNLQINLSKTSEQSAMKDSHRNTPGSFYSYFKAMARIKPNLQSSHLLDIGCGTGKILCAAMMQGFQQVTGIDLDNEGMSYAEANCAKTKKSYPSASYHIIYADAADYTLPASVNIIFFFNPFGRETLSRVITNIRRSYESAPRRIYILYQYPVFENEFTESNFSIRHIICSGKFTELLVFEIG